MLKEKVEIYEAVLKALFRCNTVGLDRCLNLMEETRSRFGKKVFTLSLTKVIEATYDIGEPKCANTCFYFTLVHSIPDLAKLKELDDPSYNLLLDTDFKKPGVRFKLEDFKWMPVTSEQKTYLTQELNFLLEKVLLKVLLKIFKSSQF